MEKRKMFDIEFDNYNFADLGDFIDRHIEQRTSTYIVTCNVDHVMRLRKDLDFQQVYNKAGAVVADGMPLIWAAKLLGKPLKQKVSGSDILQQLGHQFAKKQYSIFFLGAAPGVAEKAAINVKKRFPGISIAGFHSPSYGFEHQERENEYIINLLKEAKPDIVLVGVGAPKQEKWMFANYLQYGAPVSIGVGATFDFLSGSIKRAPRIMQKTGLEWLFRLYKEPGRLWRRYLIEDMKFIKLLLKEKARKEIS